MQYIDVTLGDSEVAVALNGGNWRIYRPFTMKRLKGVERWIMRSSRRHEWFEELLSDAVMS